MDATSAVHTPEQRKVARVEFQTHVEIDLDQPSFLKRKTEPRPRTPALPHLEANSLNLSEHGMCLRLQAALEIRSRIRMRLFPEPAKKPLECAGQVAWVVQRMDLRDTPPFVYDIGVQFIDPPARLRQLASRVGIDLKALAPAIKQPTLEAITLNGRRYLPRLEREAATGTWHLVVWIDGVPCFSHRYPSQREATNGWELFKRQTAAQNRLAKNHLPKPPGRSRRR